MLWELRDEVDLPFGLTLRCKAVVSDAEIGKGNQPSTMPQVVIGALYKFVQLTDTGALRAALHEVLDQHCIKGSILLAREGINGTVAGSRDGMDALLGWLSADGRFENLIYKESFAENNPFLRAKIKLKKEIVTIGIHDVDPLQTVGTYVDPEDWNALISDPDVVLVDARNEYEVRVGTFEGAVDPHTQSFTEFPEFLDEHLGTKKDVRVAMFCTGGIRCEKSTSYLKKKGLDEVYHLRGGILKYLETVPEAESMWQGECFVFDERVSVDHRLQAGTYDLCRACRMPIGENDQTSDDFELGVSCPHCINIKTEEDRKRYREREKQMNLASQRGQVHIGAETTKLRKHKRQQKEVERRRQRELNPTTDSELNHKGKQC
ncbi:MAG: rhodanese-related sulfurtransferase [Rhodothermia bacterium]|nr:MAG: rhodanese-related sulfurtransferase [Rhodothermia bacterium]